jgi:propionyl-CoA carboxylase beta chain
VENPAEFTAAKVKEYKEMYTDTLALASQITYIQDIIEPRYTRGCLIKSLELVKTKKKEAFPKRHGNIPL